MCRGGGGWNPQQLSAISLPHNVKSKVGGRVRRKTYENRLKGGGRKGFYGKMEELENREGGRLGGCKRRGRCVIPKH